MNRIFHGRVVWRVGSAAVTVLVAVGCEPPPEHPPAKTATAAPADKSVAPHEVGEMRDQYDQAVRKAKALTAIWGQGNVVAFENEVDRLDKLLAGIESPRRGGGEPSVTTEGRVGPPKEIQRGEVGTPPTADELARRQKAIDERTYRPVPVPKPTDPAASPDQLRERSKKARAALDGLRAAWRAADKPQVERRLKEIELIMDLSRPPAGKADGPPEKR